MQMSSFICQLSPSSDKRHSGKKVVALELHVNSWIWWSMIRAASPTCWETVDRKKRSISLAKFAADLTNLSLWGSLRPRMLRNLISVARGPPRRSLLESHAYESSQS